MTTSFEIKITDSSDANSHTFNVTRLDYNWNGQIKSYAVVSTPTSTTRGTPRFFDFGRKIEGLVIYGWMDTWDEVMAVRTLINEDWWEGRPAKFYVSSADSHNGQVADFKAYNDRMSGGEKNIKYTLSFVIASKFSESLP